MRCLDENFRHLSENHLTICRSNHLTTSKKTLFMYKLFEEMAQVLRALSIPEKCSEGLVEKRALPLFFFLRFSKVALAPLPTYFPIINLEKNVRLLSFPALFFESCGANSL